MKLRPAVVCLLANLLLVQCSQNTVPLAGTLQAQDPVADQLMAKASQEKQSGDLKGAINVLEDITEDHPHSNQAPVAWFMIGELQERRGEPVKAFDAYNNLLSTYFNSHLYQQALARQKALAFAAADGNLKYRFLGISSTVSRSEAAKMLQSVRDNAPHSKIAPEALLRLAKLHIDNNDASDALVSLHQIVDNYPASAEAPKAQFAIGETLMQASREGNQDKSNVRRAREAFEDFLQRYSSNSLAPQARQQIAMIKGLESMRTLETASFYHKIGDLNAAKFYCREVIDNPSASADQKQQARTLMATPAPKTGLGSLFN